MINNNLNRGAIDELNF